MKLLVHTFTVPLLHPFTLSRGTQTEHRAIIVELREHGISGFGEACRHAYYGVDEATLCAQLTALAPLLEDVPLTTPAALYDLIAPRLGNFARCAVDEAAHDLWGKKHNAPVHALWDLDVRTTPRSSYTIAIDTAEVMLHKLRAAAGWPIYKIKLGTDHDMQLVETLRGATAAPFRVDANCGWTPAEVRQRAPQLRELGVEFIEQPLPRDAWTAMAALLPGSALPFIADESCVEVDDVVRCRGHFHGINIKLLKCGGLTPARQMIELARQHGLGVMLGCMVETTVGISALAQLLPLADWVDMDGAALLAKDIARGVQVVDGVAVYPPTPGHGVELF